MKTVPLAAIVAAVLASGASADTDVPSADAQVGLYTGASSTCAASAVAAGESAPLLELFVAPNIKTGVTDIRLPMDAGPVYARCMRRFDLNFSTDRWWEFL